MKAGHIVRSVLGIVCAIFFVWLIARQIDLAELKSAFKSTKTIWVIAALGAFCIGYACRIARWRRMLAQDNAELTWTLCAGPLLASFAINNILPFRSGDVMRAFAFNRHLGTSSGIVLASLFVERLLDLLMVLLILGSALALFNLDFERFSGLSSILLISLSLLIVLLLLFPKLFAPIVLLVSKVLIKLAPGFGNKLSTELNKGMTTLTHLAKKGTMLHLIIWSIAAWSAEGVVFWCAAMALPDIQSPLAGWLALPVGTLATLIPSTPGYIGTFDYFTIKAMTTLGNTTSISTAYALLVHALLWFPPTITGGLYLIALNTRKSRIKKHL